MSRICCDCPAPIRSRNKSGRCLRCYHAGAGVLLNTPERRAKKSAAMKAKLNDPVYRAEHIERFVRTATNAPGRVERAKERMIRGRLWERGTEALNADPEAKARGTRAMRATKLAHIPTDYHDAYTALVRKNVPKAEATRLILDQRDHDLARFRRSIGA